MEGPTPVSALIHAATMVTAGVFLLIRCAPLFNSSPSIMQGIAFVGASTAFFASTVSLVQSDIKKITAYSTCSQLGYMVLACGLGQYSAGLFHLSTHAVFKAALFLAAGSVVHCLQGEQDVRKMGELCEYTPCVASTTVVGGFSLSGSVFASSFYSKEFILELAYVSGSSVALFAFWLGTLSALLTSFYSFRLSTGLLVYRRNGSQEVLEAASAGTGVLLLFHVIGPIAGLFLYEHCVSRTLEFSLEFFDSAETGCTLPACSEYV
jgi:NADH:ubiquinone oxidoreductase subunit 5 (subunit L)/multisubunit Na+/H+ antiporter MnhA subunit